MNKNVEDIFARHREVQVAMGIRLFHLTKGYFLGLGLLLFLMPLIVLSATYLDEGFEDNALNPLESYTCDSPTPAGCTNTARIVSSGNSGNYSFEGVYNQAGAAGFFIYPPTSPAYPEKAYLRYHFKYNSNYRAHERTKQIRWHLDGAPDLYINCNGMSGIGNEANGANSCDLGIYFGYDPSDACGWANGFYYIASPGNSWMTGLGKGSDWLVYSGDGWWYLEVMVDIPNRQLSLWLKRPGDASPTQMFNKLSLANCSNFNGNETFGELDFGWMNDITGPSGGAWYVDDVLISDTYSGPAGATSSISPPTGLRVLDPGL